MKKQMMVKVTAMAMAAAMMMTACGGKTAPAQSSAETAAPADSSVSEYIFGK